MSSIGAAAPSQSRPFLVMDDTVRSCDHFGGDWEVVECSSKAAYGCGALGQHVVDGLSLLVRPGAHDDWDNYPELRIHVTDEARRRVALEAEVDDRTAKCYGREIRLYAARIYAVDGDAGVMVLRVCFVRESRAFRLYYLVYDSIAASFSLLPCLPSHCPAACTKRPLIVRRQDSNGYSLVLMAVNSQPERPVLCLWPPTPSSEDACGVGPWGTKGRRDGADGVFRAHVAFSGNGRAFWADLARGVLHCDTADLLDGDGEVGLSFIELPEERRVPWTWDMHPVDMCRNMGCVVGEDGSATVWFVAVEPPPEWWSASDSESYPMDFLEAAELSAASETRVEVWMLDLARPSQRWEKQVELTMPSVWELDGFRETGMPRAVPKYPILRQEEGGLVLYLLLRKYARTEENLVGINVSTMRLVSSRRFASLWSNRPVVLPPDFFHRGREEEGELAS
ncbi:unnamed protein product [Alopecurus aequalis]